MNREILFKAKRTDNGEWVEGYYAISEDSRGLKQHYIFVSDRKYGYFKWVVIDKKTLCQYTGRTDMHGNKIWENDICAAPDSMRAICKICYGEYDSDGINKHIGFFTAWEKRWSYFRQDLGFWVSRIEVIGNIFDNPELTGGAL